MSSSASSNVRTNLEYEPPLYCRCGLKAPICTTRDSGKKFYGCQRWKEGCGCGFFVWKDHISSAIEATSDAPASEMEEIKNLISALRCDFLCELHAVREVIETEVKEKKTFRRKCVFFMVVIAAIMAKWFF